MRDNGGQKAKRTGAVNGGYAVADLKTKPVDAVIRALQILKTFDHQAPTMSLAEVCRRTGTVKSTTLRMLLSLAEEGLITVTPERRYTLGPVLYRLGKCYAANFRLEDHVRPVLKELVAHSEESVSFYQRVGNKRICLFRENCAQILREHVSEGETLALDKGAEGRVLTQFAKYDAMMPAPAKILGSLPLVSVGERDPGIGGIASPVFSSADGLVGAMTISGPITRLTPARIKALRPIMYEANAQLSRSLGARFYN